MPDIFTEALNDMSDPEGRWRNPESFQGYASRVNAHVSSTARHISIQSINELAPELRDSRTMIFRLGSPSGSRHTFFALAKVITGWSDYFLFDEDLFASVEKEKLSVNWQAGDLIPFTVISKLTETSYVNLALASGLFEAALGLTISGVSIPATGRSSHTFEVRPNNQLSALWLHESGQVEVDSIFLAKRNGKKVLCVVEAKSGGFPSNLPKHKLVYPILTVAPYLSEEIEIVPIYLRVQDRNGSLEYYVTECSFPDPRLNKTHINDLIPLQSSVVSIAKNSQ
ncbi:MAG: hypothetical protein CMG93_07710 [Marinomonas sp.]|uniref:DUF6997 domain-containing protein n=1 Tax=Marinomonas communis TaxID=28254 RepID=UPI000C4E3F7C|nr:hypothetical protein [Marinomonas communis]MAF15852.1 hypothetical protein [Marinomonas sp.]MCC4273705.1 hypothetical protein [Marinomonas communis]